MANNELNLEAERVAFEVIAEKYEISTAPTPAMCTQNPAAPFKYAHSNHLFAIFCEGAASRAAPAQGWLSDALPESEIVAMAQALKLPMVPQVGRGEWAYADNVIKFARAIESRISGQQGGVSDAARDVLAERQRQISAEGWTSERDDKYTNCELARAAAAYAVCSHVEQLQICGERAWPWHIDWFKRTTYRRDLIKAGALILAEIERLDRDRAAIQAQAGDAPKGGAA